MQTLKDRLLAERARTADKLLNESDEDVLDEIQTGLAHLDRVSKNLKGIVAIEKIIDDAKRAALNYVEKGAFKRAFSRNVMKKIDGLADELTSMMILIRKLGQVAPNLPEDGVHDGKMASMIRKAVGRIKTKFLGKAIKRTITATLLRLTPKQLKSFGRRPLNLSADQEKAINDSEIEPVQATNNSPEKPDDSDGPVETSDASDNTVLRKDATAEERGKIKNDLLRAIAAWLHGEGKVSVDDLTKNIIAIASKPAENTSPDE